MSWAKKQLMRKLLVVITIVLIAGIGWHLVNLHHFHPGNTANSDFSVTTHSDKKVLLFLVLLAYSVAHIATTKHIPLSPFIPPSPDRRIRLQLRLKSLLSDKLLKHARRGFLNPTPY